MKQSGLWVRLGAVVVWGIAFALVEAMVVFYIRRLFALQFHVVFSTRYTPAGFHFPAGYLRYERAREGATMVMLLAAAYLAGRTWRQRLAFYLLSFGVWDICYYIWLFVLVDWPRSLGDRDLLFLIPNEWWGPVWEPVLVSCGLIAAAVLILRAERRAVRPPRGRLT